MLVHRLLIDFLKYNKMVHNNALSQKDTHELPAEKIDTKLAKSL